jgi:hypothetical protein
MLPTHDYRISASSVVGMNDGNLFWTIIEPVWPDVQDPEISTKLSRATPGQKAILAATIFVRELDNGGFAQFFWNESGDVVAEVIAGFERLGSPDRANVVRQALTFFGSNVSVADQQVRRDLLDKRSRADKDAFFDPLNEKLYGEMRLWPLFRRYLEQHPEEFFK